MTLLVGVCVFWLFGRALAEEAFPGTEADTTCMLEPQVLKGESSDGQGGETTKWLTSADECAGLRRTENEAEGNYEAVDKNRLYAETGCGYSDPVVAAAEVDITASFQTKNQQSWSPADALRFVPLVEVGMTGATMNAKQELSQLRTAVFLFCLSFFCCSLFNIGKSRTDLVPALVLCL